MVRRVQITSRAGTLMAIVAVALRSGVAAASPFAYVPDAGDGTVSVLDAGTNQVVSVVPVGVAPADVAVTPDGTRIYVLNTGDGAAIPGGVSVIDAERQAVIATIPLPQSPVGGGIAASQKHVYVVTNSANTVTIIDTSTNMVSGSVDVGCSPLNVAVSRDDSRAYVSVCGTAHDCTVCPNGPGALEVIDTATKTVTHVTVGVFPTGLALSPDGGLVYVKDGCPAPGNTCGVSIVDTASKMLTGSIPAVGTTTGEVAIDPAGTHLYVTDGLVFPAGPTGNVFVVDIPGKTVAKTIAVGRSPLGVAVTPDGAAVLVLNSADNNASVIDPKTDMVTATVGVGTLPVAMGPFIGPEDTGLVPPDQPSLGCENRFATAVGKLVVATVACHMKAARKAFKKKPFDEDGCEAKARTHYDAALGKLTACPPCLATNGPEMRGLLESFFERSNGDIYCAGSQPFSP